MIPKNPRAETERGKIKTYIEGLDKRLSGGLPKNQIVLVVGPSGAMKSSFCFSILYNLALNENIKSLYFTLEQRRDTLLAQMKTLGIDPSKVENKIFILDIGYMRKLVETTERHTKIEWLENILTETKWMKEEKNIELVVLDSLSALIGLMPEGMSRDRMFHLVEKFWDTETTCFFIAETLQNTLKFGEWGEDFLADGIIHFDFERTPRALRLLCGIVKMRGTDIDRVYLPLVYKGNKFMLLSE